VAFSDITVLTALASVVCVTVSASIFFGFMWALIGIDRLSQLNDATDGDFLLPVRKKRRPISHALMKRLPPHMVVRITALMKSVDLGKRRRASQFSEQLPDALDQIAQALGAGLSLPQAVERASRYMPDPIAADLQKVSAHMSISHSFEQSFRILLDQYDSAPLRLVVSGIAVQSKLGGNMKTMLQRSARYCRLSHALERSLRSQTAQSRLSLKIVLFTPLVLCVALGFLMPSFISNLFMTSAGRMMLAIAVALDVIGVMWARRLLRIDLI